MLVHELPTRKRLVGRGFLKALASALDTPNRYFARQLWEGCSSPGAWVAPGSGIALSRSAPWRGRPAFGSPGRVFSRFPLAGEVCKPRRARAAAEWMYRHAMPRNNGDWLRQGRHLVPTLPCGVRDGRDAWGAFDAQTCAYRHSQSDNGHEQPENDRSWRLQNGCLPGTHHAQTAGRKEPDRGKPERFSGGRTMAVQARPSRSLAQGSTRGFV